MIPTTLPDDYEKDEQKYENKVWHFFNFLEGFMYTGCPPDLKASGLVKLTR